MSPRAGAGRVRGVLVTADGWPVPDAPVTAVSSAGTSAGRAVSDVDGGFSLDVGAGPVTLVVTAPGHHPYAAPVQVVESGVELGRVVLTSSTSDAVTPPAGTWDVDPAHSIVKASARHLGFSTVEGRFTDFAGSLVVADPPDASLVEVTIEASTITTGNATRDGHLRSADFLDVGRFPQLHYRGDRVEAVTAGRWRVHGELTLRDVTRAVPLDVTFLGVGPDAWGGTRAGFSATTQLARRDYAMNWNTGLPSNLGLVGPTLRIELEVQAVLRSG